MKAYVIKDKKGEYYDYYDFYDNLDNACIFFGKEDAKHEIRINEDCKDSEVVEITIAEGDLERKIAVLERALKNTCWLLYGTYDEHYPNCFIEKAKKELKGEKDE